MTDHTPSARAQRRAESNKAHAARLRAEARTNREAAPHIADADKRAAWLRAADAMERNAAEAEAEAARILREGARYAARKARTAGAAMMAEIAAHNAADARMRRGDDCVCEMPDDSDVRAAIAAEDAEESKRDALRAQWDARNAAEDMRAEMADAADRSHGLTPARDMDSALRAHPHGESRFYLVRAAHLSPSFALPSWTPVRVWRDRAAPDGTRGGFWADAAPYGTGKTRPYIDSAIRALLTDNACTSVRMIILPFRTREDAERAAERVRVAEADARARGAAYFDDGQAARVVRRYLADAERAADDAEGIAAARRLLSDPAAMAEAAEICPDVADIAARVVADAERAEMVSAVARVDSVLGMDTDGGADAEARRDMARAVPQSVRLDWRRDAAEGVHRGTHPGGRFSAKVTSHFGGFAWSATCNGATRNSRGSHTRTARAAKAAAESMLGEMHAQWFRDHDSNGQAGLRAVARAQAEADARRVAALPDHARIRAREDMADTARRALLCFAGAPSSAWRAAWAEAWRGAFLPALRNFMAERRAQAVADAQSTYDLARISAQKAAEDDADKRAQAARNAEDKADARDTMLPRDATRFALKPRKRALSRRRKPL